MTKTNNRTEWLRFIIDKIILAVIIAAAGYYVMWRIENTNQKNAQEIAGAELEVARLQTLHDYIPFLSKDQNMQHELAIIALYEFYDSRLAMKMGISSGDSSSFLAAIRKIGKPAAEPLQKIANETSDLKIQNIALKGAKELNEEIIILKLSPAAGDFESYKEFHSEKVFAHIKASNQIEKIRINWGDTIGKYETIEKVEKYFRTQENKWYYYTIEHQYDKPGEKNIQMRAIFKKPKNLGDATAQIFIRSIIN